MSKSFMLQATAGRIIEVHKDPGQEGEAEGARYVCAWVMLQMIILILYSTFPRCERCGKQCRRLLGPRGIFTKEIQLYLLGSPCTVWSSNINFQSESIVICLLVFYLRTIPYREMDSSYKDQQFHSCWSSSNQCFNHCRTLWCMRTFCSSLWILSFHFCRVESLNRTSFEISVVYVYIYIASKKETFTY